MVIHAAMVNQLYQATPCWPEKLCRDAVNGLYKQFSAYGNIELLSLPLTAFFCSVSCPGNLMLKALNWIGKARDEGTAIVSGFHSPVEQQALKVLLRGKQPIVICPARSLTGMALPPDWEEPHKQGRLLLLSVAADSERRITVATALARNRFVVALAERVVIVHAEPGSKTEALARYAILLSKPTLTFAENATLMAIGATTLTDR